MYDFDVLHPKDLTEAIAALDEDAQPLAGGQTLIPTLKQRLASPERLVSLAHIPELRGICVNEQGALCIGAMTKHVDVAAQSYFPALADLAGHIGDPAVRNRGTLGGSVANNDPSACYPAAVLVTGATVVTPDRLIHADDFFDGLFETALDENELITEIHFPVPKHAAYVKFMQPASRFALVGVFIAQFKGAVRVAVTGASEDGVFRWEAAESALQGSFTSAALDNLLLEDVDMIEDVHAGAEYRAHLVSVMTRRAVDQINAANPAS